MEFLLANGAFMAFLLARLLSIKEDHCRAHTAMSVAFLINGITILLGFLEVVNRKAGYPFAFSVHTSTPPILLYGTLMWFYASQLTRPQFGFRAVHLLQLLPFLMVTILVIAKNYMLLTEQRIAEELSEGFRQQLMFSAVVLLICASTQSYYWLSCSQLCRHRLALKHYFGNLDDKHPAWLRHQLVGVVVFDAAISQLYLADYHFKLMPYGSLLAIGYLFVFVYLMYLGWFGFRQGNVFARSKPEVALEMLIADRHEVAKPQQEEALALQKLMETTKLHTKPELTLAPLACATGTAPTRLSSLLNQRLGLNFFEYVNRWCVEKFKQLALSDEGKKMSLIGIAYSCGSNSKPTFNRVFRSTTGKTPSQWQAEQKK
jgi:AraC-like DNA-binding protein